MLLYLAKEIPADAVLREQVIEELILEELQLQIAERVGLRLVMRS